ncbi:hypothetical protein HALLA_16475 [Halostagnicola larsenii XH-48]|uniref:Uncharacterized protein n=1 Tax=Halostagnicola larsenii XH-48 TaxID=797299 RepID=W0JR65_9EURY|nr:hypothetical protein HALLA_16475 [Halostagnicola larsenii XH-48]
MVIHIVDTNGSFWGSVGPNGGGSYSSSNRVPTPVLFFAVA